MRFFKTLFDSSLQDNETLHLKTIQKDAAQTTNNLSFCVCKITQNKIKYFPVTTKSEVAQEAFLFCWTLQCHNSLTKWNYK